MKNAIQNTKTLIPDHFNTLIGERKFGSQWGRDFTESDFDLPWVEASDELPSEVRMDGCRYFKLGGEAFAAAFPNATLGAIPLKDIPSDAAEGLSIAMGSHGPELRVTLPADFGHLTTPTEAWLILGDNEGSEVVFTAHPGPVMTPLPKTVAVKVV